MPRAGRCWPRSTSRPPRRRAAHPRRHPGGWPRSTASSSRSSCPGDQVGRSVGVVAASPGTAFDLVGYLPLAEVTAGPYDVPARLVAELVGRALDEDLLPLGDLSAALLPPTATRPPSSWCAPTAWSPGTACATEAFRQVDGAVEVTWHVADGDRVTARQVLGTVTGPLAPVLTAERTALNFLGHLSGIATRTRAFVDAAAPLRVWDTRKTTPGLRSLEKAAVRAGGARNHRGNLSDWVMFKDNHLTALGIVEAVAAARGTWPGRTVHVECERIDQVVEALEAGADALLLDNMSPDEVPRLRRRRRRPRPVGGHPPRPARGLRRDHARDRGHLRPHRRRRGVERLAHQLRARARHRPRHRGGRPLTAPPRGAAAVRGGRAGGGRAASASSRRSGTSTGPTGSSTRRPTPRRAGCSSTRGSTRTSATRRSPSCCSAGRRCCWARTWPRCAPCRRSGCSSPWRCCSRSAGGWRAGGPGWWRPGCSPSSPAPWRWPGGRSPTCGSTATPCSRRSPATLVLVGLWLGWRWIADGGLRWAVAAGAVLGLAGASKLNALVVLVPGGGGRRGVRVGPGPAARRGVRRWWRPPSWRSCCRSPCSAAGRSTSSSRRCGSRPSGPRAGTCWCSDPTSTSAARGGRTCATSSMPTARCWCWRCWSGSASCWPAGAGCVVVYLLAATLSLVFTALVSPVALPHYRAIWTAPLVLLVAIGLTEQIERLRRERDHPPGARPGGRRRSPWSCWWAFGAASMVQLATLGDGDYRQVARAGGGRRRRAQPDPHLRRLGRPVLPGCGRRPRPVRRRQRARPDAGARPVADRRRPGRVGGAVAVVGPAAGAWSRTGSVASRPWWAEP